MKPTAFAAGVYMREMTTMKSKYALCTMLVCVASTIAAGQQVSVNYNRSQDFSQYHTYALGSNNANQVQNSILAQEAQQSINTALQGKGLQLVQESQSPDLILIHRLGYARNWRRNGWNHASAKCGGNHDRRPVRRKDQVPRMARTSSGHAQQQWQQEFAAGGKGCPKNVQTVSLGSFVGGRVNSGSTKHTLTGLRQKALAKHEHFSHGDRDGSRDHRSDSCRSDRGSVSLGLSEFSCECSPARRQSLQEIQAFPG